MEICQVTFAPIVFPGLFRVGAVHGSIHVFYGVDITVAQATFPEILLRF
jgi:hypothetical protein